MASVLGTVCKWAHRVRTAFGDSEAHFEGDVWHVPTHGIGQGNGAGPPIWACAASASMDNQNSFLQPKIRPNSTSSCCPTLEKAAALLRHGSRNAVEHKKQHQRELDRLLKIASIIHGFQEDDNLGNTVERDSLSVLNAATMKFTLFPVIVATDPT